MAPLNKKSSSISAELHATAPAAILASSFQCQRLFRVKYHRATGTATSSPASMRRAMTPQVTTCALSQLSQTGVAVEKLFLGNCSSEIRSQVIECSSAVDAEIH